MRIVRSYDYECGSKVKIHIASLSIATHAAATRLARSPPFEKSISALAKIDEATATESVAALCTKHAASRHVTSSQPSGVRKDRRSNPCL